MFKPIASRLPDFGKKPKQPYPDNLHILVSELSRNVSDLQAVQKKNIIQIASLKIDVHRLKTRGSDE